MFAILEKEMDIKSCGEIAGTLGFLIPRNVESKRAW